MSAIEPAGETIMKNLQQAVERLQNDIARVELWAGALNCFTKPIPDYDHGQTRFDLEPETAHRDAAASPHQAFAFDAGLSGPCNSSGQNRSIRNG